MGPELDGAHQVGFLDNPLPDGNVFDWLKRAKKTGPDPLAPWRATWKEAVDEGGGASAAALRHQLETARGNAPDIEVELEMLDALDRLRAVQQEVAVGSLPVIETRHRVVGTDACHFAAPASLPDDASHASGRLLFTPTRAIFVGGGRIAASPWHAVHEVLRSERDVLLVRAGGEAAAHFRFNVYGDAVVAAFLARHLRKARTTRL